MKKTVLFICFVCCAFFLQAQEIINYFEVGDNIATPVTIKTNLGTFQIYGGESIRGAITSLSAYDADGDLIVQNSYYKSEWNSAHTYHYRYYRFLSVYNSSSPNNNPSSSSSSNDNMRRSIEHVKRAQSQYIDYAASLAGIEMRGYPNFQIRAGASLTYGEFVALQAELGGAGGWILGGGIGKDFFRGEESLAWYADLGMYSGNEDNLFVMGFMIGKSIVSAPNLAKRIVSNDDKGRFLLGSGMYIGWEHYFEDIPRLGFFLLGQIGIGSVDIRAGISWKLFAKLPYLNFE